jgi:hypothetical protein
MMVVGVLGFGNMLTFQRNTLSPTSALNIWEKHTASISIPKDGDSVFLLNVDIYLWNYIAPKPKSSSALKMETVLFSKTLASTYKTTMCQNLKQHHHYPNNCENLNYHKFFVCFFFLFFFIHSRYSVLFLFIYLFIGVSK